MAMPAWLVDVPGHLSVAVLYAALLAAVAGNFLSMWSRRRREGKQMADVRRCFDHLPPDWREDDAGLFVPPGVVAEPPSPAAWANPPDLPAVPEGATAIGLGGWIEFVDLPEPIGDLRRVAISVVALGPDEYSLCVFRTDADGRVSPPGDPTNDEPLFMCSGDREFIAFRHRLMVTEIRAGVLTRSIRGDSTATAARPDSGRHPSGEDADPSGEPLPMDSIEF